MRECRIEKQTNPETDYLNHSPSPNHVQPIPAILSQFTRIRYSIPASYQQPKVCQSSLGMYRISGSGSC